MGLVSLYPSDKFFWVLPCRNDFPDRHLAESYSSQKNCTMGGARPENLGGVYGKQLRTCLCSVIDDQPLRPYRWADYRLLFYFTWAGGIYPMRYPMRGWYPMRTWWFPNGDWGFIAQLIDLRRRMLIFRHLQTLFNQQSRRSESFHSAYIVIYVVAC